VIQGTKEEEIIDEGLGGVRLAKECALKISGKARKKKSQTEAEATDLKRYDKVVELDWEKVRGVAEAAGNEVVCTGGGKELYKDPGDSVSKEIYLAPMEAAVDALSSAPTAKDAECVVINVLGGEDLILHQAMEAVKYIVQGLQLSDKAKIVFHSLCHSSFPLEYASVTVVARGSKEDDQKSTGIDRSLANGQLYFQRGKWWTVIDEDLNYDTEKESQ